MQDHSCFSSGFGLITEELLRREKFCSTLAKLNFLKQNIRKENANYSAGIAKEMYSYTTSAFVLSLMMESTLEESKQFLEGLFWEI